MKHANTSLYFLFAGILVLACEQNIIDTQELQVAPKLPQTLYNYSQLDLPEHVIFHPSTGGVNLENISPDLRLKLQERGTIEGVNIGRIDKEIPMITDAGATLGRVLFYDKSLSINNSVSCGSCHLQSKAFADDKALSIGFAGKKTSRNSMAIINPFMNENMFWDSRTPSVKKLMLEPVQHHIEMGMESLDYLHQKLSQRSYYPGLFEEAYGTPEINNERISDALSQFLCSMTTFDSKFDRSLGENGQPLNELELMGQQLFHGGRLKCAECHSGPNFAAPDFPGGSYSVDNSDGTANIGLDAIMSDEGRDGKFRIPSLRNIALTAPYMHDGRFNSLIEVLDHYSDNIKSHPQLDQKFKDSAGIPIRLNLNATEKSALIAFLKTLTDESLLQDERFSDPFVSN